MHWLDWLMMTIPVVVVVTTGLYAQRYMKSVAHFLSGGRLAGRYLLAVARGEMFAGAVVFVAYFEVVAKAGFTFTWWRQLEQPVIVIIAATGFVIWRFRETRAMTLAQFFEIRYSRNFRLFTGILAVIAGVLNFGIIPSVGARFFVSFLDLPVSLPVAGGTIPTYVVLMGAFLSVSLWVTLSGGLITNMVTDCVEGIISQVFYLAIIAALAMKFTWSQASTVLGDRPPGESLLNPFDSRSIEDFNLWYVLMQILLGVYGTMAWQNNSAYNSAALTPHESRMSGILGRWREMGRTTVIALLAVAAMTFLAHPDFAVQSQSAVEQASHLADGHVREQMSIPIALAHLLPVGIKGALCAILLLGVFGGDSTHLHSWGGIFVQDVILPMRRKAMSAKGHIRALRYSVTGVAVFAFIFGCVFHEMDYIMMWWKVTTGIYVGGAGAAIIGGLYWKKGTAAGAWTALLTGSLLSVGGIFAQKVFPGFPLNGMQISFFSALTAIGLYVVVSLLTCRQDFNMDRMLHRGAYRVIKDKAETVALPDQPARRVPFWERMIGLDANFTRGDKWIAGGLVGWTGFWAAVMVVGSIWNLVAPWPARVWSNYWMIAGVAVPIFMTLVTGIWFTWGGVKDIRSLFARLKNGTVNDRDDGTVVGGQNRDEVHLAPEPRPTRVER
jgi:SSS family solute:Na+ symporter